MNGGQKMKKVLAVLIVLGVLGTVGTTASAACRGWYGLTFNVIDREIYNTKAHADVALTKCNCVPVNNYLSAGVWIQYKYGENGTYFYYKPGYESYQPDYGSNVSSVSRSVSVPENLCIIVYAKARFVARCGSNPNNTFYREWTGNPLESIGPSAQ